MARTPAASNGAVSPGMSVVAGSTVTVVAPAAAIATPAAASDATAASRAAVLRDMRIENSWRSLACDHAAPRRRHPTAHQGVDLRHPPGDARAVSALDLEGRPDRRARERV